MADTLLSPAKHELSGTGSLAGAVLRRLVLTEADLPEGIQFLPSLFRLITCLLFLPVAMLTLVSLRSLALLSPACDGRNSSSSPFGVHSCPTGVGVITSAVPDAARADRCTTRYRSI